MADNATSGDKAFSTKAVLPPIGKSDATGPASDQPVRSKVKVRPAKLKTPLDQVLSTEGAACLHNYRPIGTPPPTSLRKSAHGEATGQAFAASSSADHFGFPKISVEDCPEDCSDNDEDGGDDNPGCPAASVPPDNRRASLCAENNNVDGGGLSPPTRLVTRDQDGLVFELTGGQDPAQRPSGKQSPLTPTKKPGRLEPILK